MKKMTIIKQFLFLSVSLLLCSTVFDNSNCIVVNNKTNKNISVEFNPEDIGDLPVSANSCVGNGNVTQTNQVTISGTNISISAPLNTTVSYNGSSWEGPVAGCCSAQKRSKAKN